MSTIQISLDTVEVVSDEYAFTFGIVEKVKEAAEFTTHENSLEILTGTAGSLHEAHKEALRVLQLYGEQLSAWASAELRKL